MNVTRRFQPITRRRALSIIAASATLPLARSGAAGAEVGPPAMRWQGIALGAEAELTIHVSDSARSAAMISACLAEIARLERIFSLHQPDSALCQLNRHGRLHQPPMDLVRLLSQALTLSELSEGHFDPSVQPLWCLIARHFTHEEANPDGPDRATLLAARNLVDWRLIDVSPQEIVLRKPGMQLTLNGMAQGYISDRVGDLLKNEGLTHALINLGECLALDRRADGSAWRIGIPDPAERSRLIETVELKDGAVATSAARGLVFGPSARFNHIVDPVRLACADAQRSVSVLAPSAATADGLSTFGALTSDIEGQLAPLLIKFEARAFVVSADNPAGRWLTA